MSTKIKLLPEKLANQIAAGEVVERPASVVKELIENSLDAGARRITIEVEAGGKKRIRIRDDGEGMSRDDALLAFERHATSKITSAEDLFAIRSLGFRGEALPSIASVSRLELSTREPASPVGTRVRIEAGVVKDVAEIGIAPGTTLEVKDLFFNLPARRKFLKTQDTELGHLADWVSRIALARPDVHFELIHHGRTLFSAPAAKDLGQRLRHALGAQALEFLVPLDRSFPALLPEGLLRIHGYVSRPEFTRASGQGLFVYVNGRFVRDRFIAHALHEAYRTLVPKGRYPVVALFIDLPPDAVDVNVHPTKHEVRFRDQAPIHQAVLESVQAALSSHEPDALAEAEQTPSLQPHASSLTPQASESYHQRVNDALSRYQSRPEAPPLLPVRLPRPAEEFSRPASLPRVQASPLPALRFADLEVIGQFHGMFIVAQTDDALILIDQHAAHERVAFERLRLEYHHDRISVQPLLFPATLDLNLREADVLKRHQEELAKVGFELEPFGGSTFVVKALPAMLAGADPQRLLADVLDELASFDRSAQVEERLEHLLAVMACHAVVRGPRNLSPEEIRRLLSDMDTIPFASRCPHGRDSVLRFPLKDLAKMFGR
jgi:DNA mismatch repair protein MutL